ncbi:glutathione S-transferase family protein [Sphingomonas rosea]|uniref:Glutathione S-transferase family protein n=1 Tax=Sphingomonas rosea TaxID=335605 RepID=A0ABP7UBY5_9SPHN
MSDLVFYTNPQSRGQIVRWMLEEVGAPYRTEILDYATTLKGDAYRAINPMMKIPAIVHDGKVVTEVAAICAYLADAFPDAGLAPALTDRADYYRYLFFAAGPLEMTFSLKAIQYEPPADKQRMFGHGNEALVFEALDRMLGDRDYVTGTFSAADLYLASELGFMMRFGMITGSPTLQAYVARCTDRDAYRRGQQLDTEAAEAMKAAVPA